MDEQKDRKAQQGKEKKKIQRFPGDFENFTKSKEFKERKDKSHKGEVKAFKKYRERTATTRDEAKTQNMAKGGRVGYKKGSGFPDLNKDGKVTKADILMGRGVIGKKKKKKKKMKAFKSPMQKQVRKS